MVVLASSVSACAALWGFQDGIPLREGGADEDALEIDATASDAWPGDVADAATDTATADRDDGELDGGPGSDTAPPDDGRPSDDADAAPACPGACLPSAVDAGWRGPFAALEVADGGALPSCADAFTEGIDLFAGADAAPATCGCSCAPPANVTCSAPQGVFSVDRMCATACAVPRVPLGACTALAAAAPQCTMNARLSFAPGTPDGGSCVATMDVDASPVAWAAKARLCAPLATAGTCGQGDLCMPASGPDPMPSYCVVHAGTVPCPASYPTPHAYGDGGIAVHRRRRRFAELHLLLRRTHRPRVHDARHALRLRHVQRRRRGPGGGRLHGAGDGVRERRLHPRGRRIVRPLRRPYREPRAHRFVHSLLHRMT